MLRTYTVQFPIALLWSLLQHCSLEPPAFIITVFVSGWIKLIEIKTLTADRVIAQMTRCVSNHLAEL